jgi:hypothetical protein
MNWHKIKIKHNNDMGELKKGIYVIKEVQVLDNGSVSITFDNDIYNGIFPKIGSPIFFGEGVGLPSAALVIDIIESNKDIKLIIKDSIDQSFRLREVYHLGGIRSGMVMSLFIQEAYCIHELAKDKN